MESKRKDGRKTRKIGNIYIILKNISKETPVILWTAQEKYKKTAFLSHICYLINAGLSSYTSKYIFGLGNFEIVDPVK